MGSAAPSLMPMPPFGGQMPRPLPVQGGCPESSPRSAERCRDEGGGKRGCDETMVDEKRSAEATAVKRVAQLRWT